MWITNCPATAAALRAADTAYDAAVAAAVGLKLADKIVAIRAARAAKLAAYDAVAPEREWQEVPGTQPISVTQRF